MFTSDGVDHKTEYEKSELQLKAETISAEIKAYKEKLDNDLCSGAIKDNILGMMSIIEQTIRVCGGDKKVMFLDVSSRFIKVYTRLPIDAKIFPFLPADENMPYFHVVVNNILLTCLNVDEIRWIPCLEEQRRGSYLLVGLKGDK